MEDRHISVSEFIRRLIAQMMPPTTSETQLQKYHSYAVRVLNGRFAPSAIEDEAMLYSLMQKRIVKRAEEENINKHTANAMLLRLSELIQRFNKSKFYQNKTAILGLLNKIGESNDLKQTKSVSPISSLFQAHETQKMNQMNQMNQSYSQNQSTIVHQKAKPTVNSFMTTSKDQQRMDIENTADTYNISHQKQPQQQTSIKENPSNKLIQKISFKGNPSQDISEADLIREILYAFQGIDGNYISFSPHEDSYVLKSTVTLSTPVRKIVYQLCETGWLFRKVAEYVQSSQYNTKGLIHEALSYTIRNELNEYYRLIAILDNLRDSENKQSKMSFLQGDSSQSKSLTLRKLYLWSMEPIERLKWLAILCDACKGNKGCALLSVVYSYAQQGSPTIQNLINAILGQLLVVFSEMIRLWVYHGELNDQYFEFFVKVNNNHGQQSEAIWNDRYELNVAMIPTFMDKQIAEDILLIGKTVNFLRRCCGVQDWVLNLDFLDITASVIASFTQTSKINEFKDWVTQATAITSKKLVDVIFQKYRLKDHCESIKKYILFGQGDFIQALMDLLNTELGKPATSIYRHNLLSVLETAIRSSNAQFHDSEFLGRLDVRLLDPSAGDQGWEIFSLDYKVDAPINTIFSPNTMRNYLRLFNFLWRIKRVEYSLSSIWVQHIKGAFMFEEGNGLRTQIHRCNLLRHEMIHFISNLQEYIMVEVIEGSWKILMEQLGEAKNLNEIIKHHENFLQTVMDKALLTSKSEHLYKRLIKLFDLTFRFKYTNEILFSSAQEEYKRKKKESYERQIRQIMGDEMEDESSMLSGREIETDNIQKSINSEAIVHLRSLWKDYKVEFTEFVNLLKQDDVAGKVRYLSFRLDFNEHYCSMNPKRVALDDFKHPNPLVPLNYAGSKKVITHSYTPSGESNRQPNWMTDSERSNKMLIEKPRENEINIDKALKISKQDSSKSNSAGLFQRTQNMQSFPVNRQHMFSDNDDAEDSGRRSNH